MPVQISINSNKFEKEKINNKHNNTLYLIIPKKRGIIRVKFTQLLRKKKKRYAFEVTLKLSNRNMTVPAKHISYLSMHSTAKKKIFLNNYIILLKNGSHHRIHSNIIPQKKAFLG